MTWAAASCSLYSSVSFNETEDPVSNIIGVIASLSKRSRGSSRTGVLACGAPLRHAGGKAEGRRARLRDPDSADSRLPARSSAERKGSSDGPCRCGHLGCALRSLSLHARDGPAVSRPTERAAARLNQRADRCPSRALQNSGRPLWTAAAGGTGRRREPVRPCIAWPDAAQACDGPPAQPSERAQAHHSRAA